MPDKELAEIKKLEAEAALLSAQTAAVAYDLEHYAKADTHRFEAEARKHDAEGRRFDAEARWRIAEARARDADATMQELKVADAQRDEAREVAKNEYHHVYFYNTGIEESSVTTCMDRLTQWHREVPKCPIEVIFFSPGGSLVPGFALFDYIQYLRSQGHVFTTVALGMAASMAGILLQAGDVRVMGKEAWMLIHEVSFGAGGKIGEVEDAVEWVKKVQKRVLDIFAKRTAGSKAPAPLTARQIAVRWKRKDWWLGSDECLKFGFVDEVR